MWSQYVDSVTGHAYWWNSQTKEARWTPPNEPFLSLPPPDKRDGVINTGASLDTGRNAYENYGARSAPLIPRDNNNIINNSNMNINNNTPNLRSMSPQSARPFRQDGGGGGSSSPPLSDVRQHRTNRLVGRVDGSARPSPSKGPTNSPPPSERSPHRSSSPFMDPVARVGSPRLIRNSANNNYPTGNSMDGMPGVNNGYNNARRGVPPPKTGGGGGGGGGSNFPIDASFDRPVFPLEVPKHNDTNQTGRKKCLLIGINYPGSASQLSGCVNDIKNMQYFLWSNFDVPVDAMLLLFDEGNTDATTLPTRANIVNGIRWLLDGAHTGDSLFFHFSGHGSHMQEVGADPNSKISMDETICPCDFETAGQIADDQLNDLLVKPLPLGVKLTAVMDCCHANTGLDVLFRHRGIRSHVRPGMLQRPLHYPVAFPPPTDFYGDRTLTVVGDWVQLKNKPRELSRTGGTGRSPAGDVVVLSGYVHPNDTSHANTLSGAITYALIVAVERNKHRALTFAELLDNMRIQLTGKFAQVPEISTSKPFDLYNTRFLL